MPGETSRRPAAPLLAEVNITPLVDVMLVLLIIFMLVTPVAQRGLDAGLPPAAPSGSEDEDSARPLVVIVEAGPDGRARTRIDDHPVTDLAASLRDLLARARDRTVFVRAVGPVRYGDVVRAMDDARGAGAERIGIITW